MSKYNFATYQPATGCTGGPSPGTVALAAYINAAFPQTRLINIYSCRDIVGGNTFSHHAEGRADDNGVPTTSTGAAIPSIGMPVVEALGPHGKALGIDHIIYNRIKWDAANPDGKTYKGLHPHRDHHHIGMTRKAAALLNLTTITHILGGPDPIPEPIPEPTPQGDIVLPLKKGDRSEDVRMFKDRMNEAFAGTSGLNGVPYKLLDIASAEFGDWFEDATQNRVRDFLGVGFTGSPAGKEGLWVGGQQWNALLVLWMKRKLGL